MGRIEITEAQLRAAFNQELPAAETEDAWTSKELVKITGWKRARVIERMEVLILAGKWERLSVPRTHVTNGVTRPTNAYRPVRSD